MTSVRLVFANRGEQGEFVKPRLEGNETVGHFNHRIKTILECVITYGLREESGELKLEPTDLHEIVEVATDTLSENDFRMMEHSDNDAIRLAGGFIASYLIARMPAEKGQKNAVYIQKQQQHIGIMQNVLDRLHENGHVSRVVRPYKPLIPA